MATIRESDLPGIGHKVVVETQSGDRLVIVIHDDGRRELYHFCTDDLDECLSMITLNDDEARQVAAIIGGMTYRPKALESVEMAFDDLIIEWYKIERGAKTAGKTIGDLRVRQRTGASIIGIIGKDHGKKINPGPDQILEEDMTLLVMGERHQIKALKDLIV